MRPNLSHERGTRIFRFSDASRIDITPQQSQKQTESAALPQCREILDVGFNVQTNRRPSQLVGSRPLLKMTEANFRLPTVTGIQAVTLLRWEREPSGHRMPSRFNSRTRLERSAVRSGRARARPAFSSIKSATTPGSESIDLSSPVD